MDHIGHALVEVALEMDSTFSKIESSLVIDPVEAAAWRVIIVLEPIP